MDRHREPWWIGPGDDDVPADGPEWDESGPPSLLDDAWFTQYVASLGYPRGKRDPIQANGQFSFQDYLLAEEEDSRWA